MACPPMVSRRFPLALATAALLGCTAAGPASAADDGVRVVATIKPVHSLVSAVMAGVGEPHLIVRGMSSPHTFTMRPSDAAALEDADIVFMIGDTMETALAGPVDALAGDARVVTLANAPGLVRRTLREGGAFEADDHDGHDHDGHDDDGHDDDEHDDDEHDDDGRDDDGRDDDGDHDDDHDDDDSHDDDDDDDSHDDDDDDDSHDDDDDHDGPFDMHVWLDPINGQAMARTIAGTLAEADPANAAVYEANAGALLHRLDRLTEEIAAQVAPARGVPFIVFHDGYRHFEDRFGLTAAGSVVVHPGRAPGARRIAELRDKIHALGVTCVFAEPQFDQRLVRTVIEGSTVRAGTVDPLGAAIEDGPALYATLLRTMAAAFKACLVPDDGA